MRRFYRHLPQPHLLQKCYSHQKATKITFYHKKNFICRYYFKNNYDICTCKIKCDLFLNDLNFRRLFFYKN